MGMTIVNICSPTFDPCDSYGRIANELSFWLEAWGQQVNQIGDQARKQAIRPSLGGILLGYPTNFWTYGTFVNTGPRIAITMFESTVLPDGWAEKLNRCDAVVVPSRFLMDVFRANGVTAPIRVIPLGISNAFHRAVSRGSSTPFTFLAIADRGRRKAWDKATFAFDKAFGGDMNYRLILKARQMPFRFTNPNIEVVSEDLTDGQLAQLYSACHVMIFPSCGEGFGLPPREFAATGGIALATDWGGTADDLEHWGIPLPVVRMVDAWPDQKDWRGKLGQWAEVDTAALAETMKQVAAQYERMIAFRLRAARFVWSHYHWATFANRVNQLWDEILERKYGNHADSHRDQPVAEAVGVR